MWSRRRCAGCCCARRHRRRRGAQENQMACGAERLRLQCALCHSYISCTVNAHVCAGITAAPCTCGRHAVVRASLYSLQVLATVAAQWLHSVWLHNVPCALCQTMCCVRLQAASGTIKVQGKKVQHRSSVLCAGSAPFCA